MVHFYICVTGNKIVHAEISDLKILSEQYHSLYYGPEEEMPNFLPKGIRTSRGGHIYSYINDEVVERSAEEIAAEEEAANPTTPEPDVPSGDTSVWDELDAAYQEGYQEGYVEGVNAAYEQ